MNRTWTLLLMFCLCGWSTPGYSSPHREGDRIRLDERILFEFDTHILKRQSTHTLRELAQYLNRNPRLKLEVHGHTDKRGSAQYNLRLSTERAQEVVRFLIQHGVQPHRLSARGYGESRPRARGSSERAYALNRRVEFIIVE